MRLFPAAFVPLTLLAVLASQAASAHHSTAGYDAHKAMAVTGVVTKFYWTNPHSFIYLLVSDSKGGTTEWKLECGTPNINVRHGWKANDIKVGDKITVEFHPARDETRTGQSTIVTLANGQKRYAPGYDAALLEQVSEGLLGPPPK